MLRMKQKKIWILTVLSLILSQGIFLNLSHAQSLKDLAQVHGIKIGTAVQPRLAVIDPTYELTVLREFNLIIPENDFKMALIHPEKDVYNFTITDAIMDYAEANSLEVNGHTLVWGHPDPPPV